MRQLIIIALLFFCLHLAVAQTTTLQKRVSIQMADVTLEKALGTLKKQYGIRFSYANSLIPVGQKVNVSIKNQPLSSVLDELLKDTEVVYKLMGDQIVLRNDPNKRKESSASEKRSTFPPINRIESIYPPVASTKQVIPSRKITMEPIPVQVPDYAAEQRNRRRKKIQEVSEQVAETVEETARKVASDTKQVAKDLDKTIESRKAKRTARRDSITNANEQNKAAKPASDGNPTSEKVSPSTENNSKTEVAKDSSAARDSSTTEAKTYETRPFQLSFVPPLSTNGIYGSKYINSVSINVLAGYTGGVNGVEFGSIANLNKGTMKGAQFSGMLNIVGDSVEGAQFAGFANIVNNPVRGVQFAGFANITKGSVTHGGQFAGFANIAKGDVSAVQAAGFINVAQGDVQGVQAAGFANITRGDVSAPQLAGFINTARQVNGLQIAGFINIARNVKGVQLGVINFADSVSGVQIGLLNFARHGYYRFEVWSSETMYANAAFKMGSRKFHNIFALGYRPEGSHNYIAYGLGFGSEMTLSPKSNLNLDVIAWQISYDNNWIDGLNLHNQLRANVSFRLANHLHLFAGPTFNVYVSNVYDSEKGRYGIPLTPWKIYDKTNGRTNVVMWPGFNVGIRF